MKDTPDKTKMLAWITGAGGLIGSHIAAAASVHAPQWRVRALTRGDFDLSDFKEARRQFELDRPKLVIHCAAISDPSQCETQPARTRLTNREATFFLSCLAQDIPMIFFSSDLVFDGKSGNYTEEDKPAPLTIYARTKAEAEALVLANPLHSVVRTSLTAGQSPKGNRGIEEQLNLRWSKGKSVKLFSDEYRSPIAAECTARAIWELASAKCPGLYHLGGRERMSRLEIGLAVASRHPAWKAKIETSSIHEYDGPPRAADTSLDCTKLQRLLSFPLTGLREWLTRGSMQQA